MYFGDIALALPANLPEGSYKYIMKETKHNKIKVIGKMDNTIDNTFECANRVYDKKGVCPTIPTQSGSDHIPKIIQETEMQIVAMRRRNPERPTDRTAGLPTEQRLEANAKGIANALTTVQKDNMVLERKTQVVSAITQYRIRNLTPRECWRLMGYTDEDFEKASKVNSNTQLYKQAGNAIVKQVLMAIFSNMNIKEN